MKAGPRSLLYGTENGLLGWIQLVGGTDGGDLRGIKTWVLQNSRKQGAINCISLLDVVEDDVRDIVVGRDDGYMQVSGSLDTQPAVTNDRTHPVTSSNLVISPPVAHRSIP